jgi:HEAT repeat protein
MLLFFTHLLLTTASASELKLAITRQLGVESYQEASKLCDQITDFQDPETIYFMIQAYASDHQIQKALNILDAHKTLLKESHYLKKCLEVLALSVFKTHFHSTQEPIKLASLASISLESDARVLDLILEAFESPSMKVKMMALRGLSGFADEKVKKVLLQTFKHSPHPAMSSSIAKIFASWQDKRILPLLFEKLNEDGLSLDEKLNYMVVIKELSRNIDLKQLKGLCKSKQASERLLATYLLSSKEVKDPVVFIKKLLNDSHLWVKQSALMTVIKRKIHDPAIDALIDSWKDDKSFELKKAYYYWGLIHHRNDVIEAFKQDFIQGSLEQKKILASILYSSGSEHEDLIEELLVDSIDPYIRMQLGLYLLSSDKSDVGVDFVCQALEDSKNKKIFAISEPILPFFSIQDENCSNVSINAGQRRSMDKHMRLKIFHLLAIKKMPQAKNVLKELLKSDLFEVSLDAMVHFWENFGYQDSEYLKNILNDHDPELRLKAALVLSYLDYDKDIRKYLIDNYHKQTYSMQIQILFALSKYSEEDVFDFYIKQIRSKYPLIQAVGAGCLFTSLYN